MTDRQIKQIPVMIVKCFFDETGILPNDKVTIIAGFMGSPTAMNKLDKKWKATLKRFGVKVPFHSKEFFAPRAKTKLSKKNPYAGWSNTKRKRFVNALYRLIADRELRLKAVAIDSIHFRSKTEAERRYLTGGRWFVMEPEKWLLSGKPASPYHFAFRIIVESCGMSVGRGDRVHIIMSTQDNFEGYAVALYQAILDRKPPFKFRQHLEDSIMYASHVKYAQLQAADFAAYWIKQIAIKRRADPDYSGTEEEKRFLDLRWEVSDTQFATAKSIDQLCVRYSQRRKETDHMALLRRTSLRRPIIHDPKSCRIIGRVDEAGNYRQPGRSI